MAYAAITIQKGSTSYELEVDYFWEDRRMGLLKWEIESVTALDGPKPEHDLDPTLFAESLDDNEIADLEASIRDKS